MGDQMSGTIPLSLTQQFDSAGKPLANGKLYLFAAGTTTPQSAYQNTALTIAHPNPITLDAAGRVPQFFLADGQIKIRLTNADGVVQVAADNILVIGASSGAGGGASVDATTVLATGDIKWRYGTGILSGFVRGNGRTIGSAVSGATERANADCEALFISLYNADANLAVSGGRSGSAIIDWGANKTIALPDVRGRLIAAMDDMGNSSAARMSSLSSTTLGAAGGSQTHTLATSEIPPHSHAVTDPGHAHSITTAAVRVAVGSSFDVTPTNSQSPAASTWGTTSNTTGITIGNAGGGGSHNNVQPTIFMTCYIKL